DTCDICDATAADVQRALDGIQPPPQLLILRPRTVSEILESIMAVGPAARAPHPACTPLAALQARLPARGPNTPPAPPPPRACAPWPQKPRTPTTDHGWYRSKV